MNRSIMSAILFATLAFSAFAQQRDAAAKPQAGSPAVQARVPIPILEFRHSKAKDALHFEDSLDSYVPNPFVEGFTCVNTGGSPAMNVTAFVYLPANTVLADSTESLRKAYPSPMMTWHAGDSLPEIQWAIRYTKRLRYDTQLDFKFVAGGVDSANTPIDSVYHFCHMLVPGLQPSYTCLGLRIPDSLALNAEGTDVTPNPFTITHSIWNSSHQTGTINVVDLNYPIGDGLTLDPSTPKTRTLNRTLAPGDTLTVTWVMHVQNRITRRFVQIMSVAYDDEGNPIACDDAMPIANLLTGLACASKTSDSLIRYTVVNGAHEPETWIISSTLTSTGGAPVTDVDVELELMDSSLVALQEFDPDFPDNTNPKGAAVLLSKASRTFEWGFRSAAPNHSGVSKFLQYSVRYRSKETAAFVSGCTSTVEVFAATLGASQPPAPQGYELRQNTPNPFSSVTTISYDIPSAMHVRVSVYDVLGREVGVLENALREAGRHSAVFEAPQMPNGIYMCRFEAAGIVKNIRMLLLR